MSFLAAAMVTIAIMEVIVFVIVRGMPPPMPELVLIPALMCIPGIILGGVLFFAVKQWFEVGWSTRIVSALISGGFIFIGILLLPQPETTMSPVPGALLQAAPGFLFGAGLGQSVQRINESGNE